MKETNDHKDYIEVTVEFLSSLKEGIGLKDRKVKVQLTKPYTLQHLIEVLEKLYPKLQNKIKDSNKLLPYLLIAVNGYEVMPGTLDKKELSTGDEIMISYLGVGG
ncbi:MAG: sulfur-carrier protein [Thermosediminibacterales bacterium]|nr:sulfur-carrier protein [Thermosediminibacterales bacterium]MDK2836270.1 sulfur-carrier protein [Thermosediminibacterales bacterium]